MGRSKKVADDVIGEIPSDKPERLPRTSRLGRQATDIRQQEAFEHWYMQGVTGGERDLHATADALGLKRQQVKQWFNRYNWADRAESRGIQIAAKIDEQVIKKVAEVKAEYHTIITNIIHDWYRQHFGNDAAKELAIAQMDAETIARLVRLDLVLLGEPETRRQVEGVLRDDTAASLRNLSTADLEALVNARRERQALPEATVTVEVTPTTEEPQSDAPEGKESEKPDSGE